MTARNQQFCVGFRPVVRARVGAMLGIRQPLDGPVFEKLEHAQYWCWHAMLDHYERAAEHGVSFTECL